MNSKEVEELISNAKDKNLQQININCGNLGTLPSSIGQVTSLLRLTLVNNMLTTLPESIGQLTNLKSLEITDNRLTTLPESIQYGSVKLSATLANWLDVVSFHQPNLVMLP
jgi:Leucine-rich repeat (LRR) protein